MEIAIYKSTTTFYRHNETVDHYSFVPVEHHCSMYQSPLDGEDIAIDATTEDSELVATIIAPEGSKVAKCDNGEIALFIAGDKYGTDAYDALSLAQGRHCGLSIK